MTSEINSALQNLLPSTRELPSSSVARINKGQATEAAQQPEVGSRLQEDERKAEDGKEIGKESLDGAVSDLNQIVQQLHRELQFSIQEESGETVVKVIDTETDEVIRQIPAQELIELKQRLADAAGALFQDSV